MNKTLIASAALSVLLTACTQTGPEAGLTPADVPEPPMLAAEDVSGEAINAALLNEARRPDHSERDALRKPEAVLDFMGIQPGDTVLELEAGGGYFTHIFSNYLGPDGTVYMQNPAAFDGFFDDDFWAWIDGFDNVEYLKTDFDALSLEDGSVDAVTWFQGPHELWYTPDGGSIVTDVDAVFPDIYRVLKPGGSFTVIDHSAPAGSPATTGGETHRIDPQIVRDMASEAGFVFVSQSEVFANRDDDMTTNVFDESIRGKTDQFMLKFEKPE